MKHNFFKIVLVLVLTVLAVSTSFAQNSASKTATATALIIAPISIGTVTNMDFGNIVTTPAGGTVVLPPSGSRTYTGNITSPTTAGNFTSARFPITADATYPYTVTMPATDFSLDLTGPEGSTAMKISTWTSNLVDGPITSGSQILKIGATLTVGESQTPGTYTSEAFTVTVNYN